MDSKDVRFIFYSNVIIHNSSVLINYYTYSIQVSLYDINTVFIKTHCNFPGLHVPPYNIK